MLFESAPHHAIQDAEDRWIPTNLIRVSDRRECRTTETKLYCLQESFNARHHSYTIVTLTERYNIMHTLAAILVYLFNGRPV